MAWELTETYRFDHRTVRYGIRGNGPPVVAVHGTPWSSYNLRHLIIALASDYTVHYYDLIGYGQSDKAPGDVSLGIQNQLLESLLHHWGLHKPSIIGHDFGGATVLRAHLLNNCDFKNIVLIDPVALSPWGSPFFQHVRRHEAAFAGVPDYIHDAIVRAYINTAAHTPIADDVLDEIVKPWATPDGKHAFYRQIAQADAVYTDEVQQLYGQIDTPVLILWGVEDTWIPIEKGQALHQLIPGASFHAIADTGHLVIEECPDQLIAQIRRFLRPGDDQYDVVVRCGNSTSRSE